MPAIHIGGSYSVTEEGYRADPVSGAVTFERTFNGASGDILALTAALTAQGASVSRKISDGINVVVAQWNRNPDSPEADEVPADVWDDDTLTEDIDLFDTEFAVNEASDFSSVSSAANYRKLILDAISEGKPFPLAGGESAWPVAYSIYRLLARGVKFVPVNRPILTRNRSFSPTYTPRNRMEFSPKVWSTSRLIVDFSIPAAVSARFPLDPPAATLAEVWGWRLTTDRSSYTVATGKIQEVRTWVFGKAERQLHTVLE